MKTTLESIKSLTILTDGFGDAFKAISWIKGILCTGLGCPFIFSVPS